MSQTYIRTFLIASATFLALEAGPVMASLAVRQSASRQSEAVMQSGSGEMTDFPRTWMAGQLFDPGHSYQSRRDCE